jgi:hypothetical protein
MSLSPFSCEALLTAGEALHIAEDKIGDFFKFSSGQWKRHPFSVRTLAQLGEEEVISDAFALLQKYSFSDGGFDRLVTDRDHYSICLQDHEILKALRRDKELSLLPLLVYVFTHELVHIVRFCNFMQRFEAKGKDRDREERVVHSTTYEILRRNSMPYLDYVLDSYQTHRVCELALS